MTATANYYHCSLKPIGRSAGRSAVACAAYRAGASLPDTRYGVMRDFSRKTDVVTSFTLAPDGAPGWAFDTGELWNAVEAKENRKNSQLAFEWEVALPNELDDTRREAVAREFAGWLVEEYGAAVTVGIHSGGNRGNGKNDHMHVMMTTREIGSDGWGAKLREFSTKPGAKNREVDRVREHVADLINDALEDSGSDWRVDHRSFRDRGIDQEPTTHLGPAASASERRGFDTERGDINRAIIEDRLRWQIEQAEPEVTVEVERELAARFGDAFAQMLGEAQACGEVPSVVEHASRDAIPMQADMGASAKVGFLVEPRGWRERLRAFRDAALAFWRGETGGVAGEERGLLARTLDVGRGLWTGWQHEDTPAPAEEIEDAWRAGHNPAAKAADEAPPDDSARVRAPHPVSWTERITGGAQRIGRLLSGRWLTAHRDDVAEEATGTAQGAETAEDYGGPGEARQGPAHAPAHGHDRERARPGGIVETPEPDEEPQAGAAAPVGASGAVDLFDAIARAQPEESFGTLEHEGQSDGPGAESDHPAGPELD